MHAIETIAIALKTVKMTITLDMANKKNTKNLKHKHLYKLHVACTFVIDTQNIYIKAKAVYAKLRPTTIATVASSSTSSRQQQSKESTGHIRQREQDYSRSCIFFFPCAHGSVNFVRCCCGRCHYRCCFDCFKCNSTNPVKKEWQQLFACYSI